MTIFKMGELSAKIAFYCIFIHFLLVGKVVSRHLQYNAAELVSDGTSDGREDEYTLRLKGMDSSEEECKLMYGFLPCSTNIPSHIFLIVIYEYLLYHGESYAGGDGRIFRVLGKNFFVSSFSQLLDALPDSLILLVTGLASSKEKAQEYVLTGAGLLAGSSILLLTLLWGLCLICGNKKFYKKPESKVKNPAMELLTGFGVLTDAETSYHATVMFFSLIPFLILLLPSVFGLSYSSQEYRIVLLVSLSASVICLITYFCYQCYDPRISERRLEYAEVEQKVEMHVSFYDVQGLMLDREKHLMTRQKKMEQRFKNPVTTQERMSKGEFYREFEDWLNVTKKFLDDPHSVDQTETEYNPVQELLRKDKKRLIELMSLVMEKKFHTEDGSQDESAINRLFNDIDTDQSGFITPSELQEFVIKDIDEETQVVAGEIEEIIMRYLDNDRNGKIDKREFISGILRWLDSRNSAKQPQQHNTHKIDTYHVAKEKAKANEKLKALILLTIGIGILTVLAEPLVESVRQFSESVKIEPFYVSFILVPLATNARTAIAAIRAARQKKHHTTSLTFSEIYHKVFLNNILGFCVLVSVIYFRGFTWHFSAEILVVVMVCIIMGLLASFKSKFPIWTLLIAVPLYPLSMVVVYFVNDAFQFT